MNAAVGLHGAAVAPQPSTGCRRRWSILYQVSLQPFGAFGKWGALFVMLLLALMFVAPASAAEPAVWEARRLTPESADEGCIGTARSPVCALETLFACTLRQEVELCRALGLSLSESDAEALFGVTPGPDGLAWRAGDLDFRVFGVESGSERQAHPYARVGGWIKPDDASVQATLRFCTTFEDGAYGCWRWSDREFIFRLIGGTWRLVAWDQAPMTFDVDHSADIVRRVFIPAP
jgi:hypothetical protein